MNDDYKPEFYELVMSDGRRYLSYKCANCNTNHLIRSSSKEISRIRLALKMVNATPDDKLILSCQKTPEPEYDGNGITIRISPQFYLPKSERDAVRKRINRILGRIPHIALQDNELVDAIMLLKQKLEKLEGMKIRTEDSIKQMKSDIELLEKGALE